MSLAQEIKMQSSMRMIFDYYGIVGNRQGQYLCPFHDDHKPSMTIKDDKYFRCWTCGESGSVLNFIKNYEENVLGHSMSWRDVYIKAIEIQGLNISLNERTETPEQRKLRRLNELMRKAFEISKGNLAKNHTLALACNDYLTHRKISTETIKKFNIGFELDNSFVRTLIQDEGYTLSELKEVGLINTNNKGRYYEVFSNRVLVPIYNSIGQPVGFGGRILPQNETSSSSKYINTSATPLFNKSNILFNYNNAKASAVKQNNIVILEGYFDVISAYEMGMPNTVGLMGVALSDKQISLLKDLNCDVTLALDNDKTGRVTMLKLIPTLLDKDINTYVYDTSLIEGNLKDFGDFLTFGKTVDDVTQTKVSAFDYLLQYKYFEGKQVNASTVYMAYKQGVEDGLLNNTRRELMYRDFVVTHSDITKDEYEEIIHPKEINNKVDKLKNSLFIACMKAMIEKYAAQTNNRTLVTYCHECFDERKILEGLSQGDYLSEDGSSFSTNKFITEFIMDLPKYRKLEKDVSYKYEGFLNNAYCFDKFGKKQRVYLTSEQKNKVIEQFIKTSPEDVKQMVLDKPDLFTELVITDNVKEYESLFLPTNFIIAKKDSLDYYKRGNIAFINYGQAFKPDEIPKLHQQGHTDYVSLERMEFKKVVVYNNTRKGITLTPQNYLPPKNDIKISKDNERVIGRDRPVMAKSNLYKDIQKG